jgi:hypothetical protein
LRLLKIVKVIDRLGMATIWLGTSFRGSGSIERGLAVGRIKTEFTMKCEIAHGPRADFELVSMFFFVQLGQADLILAGWQIAEHNVLVVVRVAVDGLVSVRAYDPILARFQVAHMHVLFASGSVIPTLPTSTPHPWGGASQSSGFSVEK